jgi:hypothetical protein
MGFALLRRRSTHLGPSWQASWGPLKAADNDFGGYPTTNVSGLKCEDQGKMPGIPPQPSAENGPDPLHIGRYEIGQN